MLRLHQPEYHASNAASERNNNESRECSKTSEQPEFCEVRQGSSAKSALFRVVHSDGVWCSVNPWGLLHLTFYSERQPIPTSVYFALNEQGGVTREEIEKREGKEGWFRELEVDVVLTPDGARNVYQALGQFLGYKETTKPTEEKK